MADHLRQLNADRILRLKQVQEIIPLSRSEIYRRIQEERFPKQIKLGARASGWRESDITAFLASLQEAV